MLKISVIIPAFNEEESVGRVLAEIPRDLVHEIIVVNNGSTDNTPDIAMKSGATVIDEKRRGYGSACLRGLEFLEKKKDKPDIVVFLDGDYSDHPGELVKVVKPITVDGCDIVIGSRTLGKSDTGAMLPQAIIGNKLATFLIRVIYGVKFTDLGPFRAIKYEKLLQLDMKDRTFGWTVEMQIKAAKKGFVCTEVPVSYRKRIGESKITGTFGGTIKAGYKIIWTILKYI